MPVALINSEYVIFKLNMKKCIILTVSILVIFVTGCVDGLLVVHGCVINDDFIKSQTISDSLFSVLQPSNGIKGVFIQIDSDVQDSLINFEKVRFKNFSDSVGYFDLSEIIGPGNGFAGIVASKEGYLNDTLFFNYSGYGSVVNIIVNLKKKQKTN